MRYSVLIPVYNGGKSLEQLAEQIKVYFHKIECSFEIVFVDDHSCDESWTIIKRLSEAFSFVKGIHLNKNYGQQMALYVGLHHCTGEWIVTMDDDLQHGVESFDTLIKPTLNGADLVFAVYQQHGDNKMRSLGSRMIGLFFKRRFAELGKHHVSSFRLIKKTVVAPVLHQNRNFVYISAELIPHAKAIDSVKVTRQPRRYGKSGYTLLKCTVIALKLNLYYGRWPIQHLLRGNAGETRIDGWCGQLPIERDY